MRPVEISASRFTLPLRTETDGTRHLRLSELHDLPHIMGNADPLHAAELLPGVQTTSEYDAGLHIWGCDNAHNEVSLDGTPLYGVQHLLGFFSVFNAAHFQSMTFAPTASMASAGNRLGGLLRMEGITTVPERATGELAVGPLSSQGTLRLPLSQRTALVASAREAYANLLYSHWLRTDREQLRYAFGDYNLTLLHHLSERDVLKLNAYAGHDNASLGASKHVSQTTFRWGNQMASLQHSHQAPSGGIFTQQLYFTRYANRLHFDQQELRFSLPSSIWDMGYQARWQGQRWKLEGETSALRLQPQSPQLEGTFHAAYEPEPLQHMQQVNLQAEYRWTPGQTWTLRPAMKVVLLADDLHRLHWMPAPSLSVEFTSSRAGTLLLHIARQVQPLFQTGLTSAGLPVEFWLAAGRHEQAQTAWHASLSHRWVFANGLWELSTSLYFKALRHQLEYGGNLLDFISDRYQLEQSLLHGHGYNTGLNIMLARRTGPITGWISYAYTRSRRRFTDAAYTGYYPSNHERPHELNAVATWHTGKRWSFGATLAFCSGTPFTTINSLYLVSHKLMMEQGRHNAERLKSYMRLDLSANWNLRQTKRQECGLNFSLYNATASRNELYYRIRFADGGFSYQPRSFAIPLLPSVNLYIKWK